MTQRLLVEGTTDLHFISNLALAMGFPKVKGYETFEKYKQFAKPVQGKSKLRDAITASLNDESLTNLGIVLDTDDQTIHQNWQFITEALQVKFVDYLPKQHAKEGTVIETPTLTIGIWMMPNNESEGYLEHFFEELIDKTDEFWQLATATTEGFMRDKKNRFKEIHKQKADVHTWLSWQKDPEAPMGLSLHQNPTYFNLATPTAQNFKIWWAKTFQLND